MSTLIWLLTFEGSVNRRQYFLSGLVLVAIKYSIDSFVASRFGEPWKATNYIFPPSDSILFGLTRQNRSLYLTQYAWGLFLGVPFIAGFVTSWFLNAGGLHSRKQTIGLCALTPILIGLFLIGFRLEGLVCLLMALPLALPFSMVGGLVAHYCLGSRRVPLTPPAATACVAIVPFFMFVERAVPPQPPRPP